MVALRPDRAWLWEIRSEGGICTLPVIADDGTILLGTVGDDGALTRDLDAGKGLAWAVSHEGKKKWTYQFPRAFSSRARDFGYGSVSPAKSPACSQPAVATDGTTYWLGHGVYALTSDGALRWVFDPGEDFQSVVIAEDGTVYARTDATLFALAPNGVPKWKYSLEKEYFVSPLTIGTNGTIYLTNQNHGPGSALLAFAPQGTLKWRNQSYEFLGSPLVAPDGTVYQEARDIQNRTLVVALDPNGQAKWHIEDGSIPFEVASDGTLYLCRIRDLLAVSARDKMMWKAQLPENPDLLDAHDPTKAVTLASSGKFYVGDFLGRLGTLDAPAGLATSGWPARFHDSRNTARAGAR